MNREITEPQLSAWSARFSPASIFVGLTIPHSGDMRPAIVGTRLQNIDLIIGLRPVLGGIGRAVRAEVDTLHVAVTISEDMANYPVKPRVVRRNGTIGIQAKRFAYVCNIFLAVDFLLGRQTLSF